ncbi:MAG: phosphatase PAP2 family protein [Prevotellaceae bacterium]|jgi:hypothetical protein|nr:phosphatase PAP2 family protein [Prevotellaceae bacterium]
MKSKNIQRIVLQVVVVSVAIYLLETISYFYIAEQAGAFFGINNTLNLQLPFDRLTPWFTPLFAIYIPWPFIWFVVLPLVMYLSGGKKSYYQYVVNSFFMYIIGSIIYALMPSTTTPRDFIDGTINVLSPAAPFYDTIKNLSRSGDNIWGSFPSYHNYWAALFIFFAFKNGTRWFWRYPMILMGVLISLSTLFLHQHCLLDIIITYAMTVWFMKIIDEHSLDTRFEMFLDKLFRKGTIPRH